MKSPMVDHKWDNILNQRIFLANQPCDLSGILVEQPNGKFDFGDHKERFQTKSKPNLKVSSRNIFQTCNLLLQIFSEWSSKSFTVNAFY